ncbi:hypothetical protein PoB_003070000 [Plakobranchus ocellatus]|uniref:Uncharacterized protein n=1 Tax=Plakobranchus ocellatus TaxID=259542 RepID=A0AAV4A7Q4_9GAST|nr:hypothetical protein PoB_003070000 [Plakobranchus ocellatus]
MAAAFLLSYGRGGLRLVRCLLPSSSERSSREYEESKDSGRIQVEGELTKNVIPSSRPVGDSHKPKSQEFWTALFHYFRPDCIRDVGGTVDSESALRSIGSLLPPFRALPPATC